MKRLLTILALTPTLATATPTPVANPIAADFTKCTKPNPPGYCCDNPHSPYYHSPYYCPEPSTMTGIAAGAAVMMAAVRDQRRRRRYDRA
jgi:hypothetical protein